MQIFTAGNEVAERYFFKKNLEDISPLFWTSGDETLMFSVVSVCHSVHRREGLGTGSWPWPPRTCSNLFTILGLYCRQAGSWHSTEILSFIL